MVVVIRVKYGSEPESEPPVGVASVEGLLESMETTLLRRPLLFFFLWLDDEEDFLMKPLPFRSSLVVETMFALVSVFPKTESFSLTRDEGADPLKS